MILVSVVSVEQKNDGMIDSKTYPVLGCPPQDLQTNNLLLPFCEFVIARRRVTVYRDKYRDNNIGKCREESRNMMGCARTYRAVLGKIVGRILTMLRVCCCLVKGERH